MNNKNHLSRLVTKLNEGRVSLDGKLILGQIVGDLRAGGFFEAIERYEGEFSITPTDDSYKFELSSGQIKEIQTSRKWVLYSRPVFNYSSELRKELKDSPHLMIDSTEKTTLEPDFAILYDANHQ